MKLGISSATYLSVLGLLLPVVLWVIVVAVFHPPSYLLPAPWDVWHVLVSESAMLWGHARITFIESLLAFGLALFLGALTASAMALCKGIRFGLMPFLLASQAIPIFAIAPLLVVWLGFGWLSKVAVALLVLYFPITLSLYEGLCALPQKWLDMAHVCGSSRWKIFMLLQWPFALGRLGSGLKMAAVWAPMGAVVGEWVGSSQGLGFLMLEAHARLELELVFAALIILLAFSFLLYTVVDLLFRRWIFWERFL